MPEETLLLSRGDVTGLLTIDEYMVAIEQAFKLHGEGKTLPPGILGIHARDGGFHIKAGLLELERSYFAAKVNANFPHNSKRFGLPLIQGVIVLCDAENGYPLALMDSMDHDATDWCGNCGGRKIPGACGWKIYDDLRLRQSRPSLASGTLTDFLVRTCVCL
jgi:hypothetical protein